MTETPIDAWFLFHSSLWLAGLATVLSAVSVASYQSSVEHIRLRQAVARPGFQFSLSLGLALVCAGLLFAESTWWVRLALALLGILFLGILARLWWQYRAARLRLAARPRPSSAELSGQARRARRLGWTFLLAGLLIFVAWAAVTGLQVVQHVGSLKAHLDELEVIVSGTASAPADGLLEAASRHLSVINDDLEAIDRSIGPLLPLGRVLRYVPRHGGDLLAASDLMEVYAGLASAGERVVRVLASPLGSEPAPGQSLSERFLLAVVAAEPELRAAREELAAVAEARARIDPDTLSPSMADLIVKLDGYSRGLDTGLEALMLVPQLLGADGARTYLVLAQNNHELRPTGGFISAVGELTLENGRVSSLSFMDSYAVDNWQVPHELAPPDLQATVGGELWVFRDANWYADFPSSARQALDIYAQDRGIEVGARPAGLIALDLTGLALLLDAIGPLSVDGIDVPVTGENVQEIIEANWENPPLSADLQSTEWWRNRKDIFGAIADAAMGRLLAVSSPSVSGLDLIRLARAVLQALPEKQILLYFDDAHAAELLAANGWDGALANPAGSCDLLMVVDSNVGFNKADPNVERFIDYQVDLSAVRLPRARLTLTYRNHGQRFVPYCLQEARYGATYADMMDACYWDYVRVYVPQGSKLLSGPDLDLPPGSLLSQRQNGPKERKIPIQVVEGDWAAWTAFFDLPPGEERNLTFEYRLPASVVEYTGQEVNYCLHVGKQPGTTAIPFRLQAIAPPNAKLTEWAPPRLSLGELAWTELRTNQDFMLHYEIDWGSP